MNVTASQTALVNTASNATPGTVQGSAALSVLKQAMDAQKSAAAQLIAALPQPVAAGGAGGVGGIINTYA